MVSLWVENSWDDEPWRVNDGSTLMKDPYNIHYAHTFTF